MIDRELESAFDELFVGDDPPRSVDAALGRLPPEWKAIVDGDADAQQTLAELVWMSNLLRDSTPRPAAGFAERIADAAFRTSAPAKRTDWRFAWLGSAVAAMALFAFAVKVWQPQPAAPVGPELANSDPIPPAGEPPAFALIDRVKQMVPRLPSEPSLGNVEVASLLSNRDTESLAKTIVVPADNLAAVGKTLGYEVRPIRDSVRDAFAFLGEFPVREKRSL